MNYDHRELAVGGPLDEQRLRAIMSRGYELRNLSVPASEAFEYRAEPLSSDPATPNNSDGETPLLVSARDPKDRDWRTIELHVGCGELCGELAIIPYLPDPGEPSVAVAEALVHAGRDLIDLVREVLALRKEVERLERDALMACETPPERCDCPGCSMVRELAARGELGGTNV